MSYPGVDPSRFEWLSERLGGVVKIPVAMDLPKDESDSPKGKKSTPGPLPDPVVSSTTSQLPSLTSQQKPTADKIDEPEIRIVDRVTSSPAKDSPGKMTLTAKSNSKPMTPGEEVVHGTTLCPWHMARHYPEWYIGKANRPRASPFFDEFYKYQKWDFYYIYSPDPRYSTPYWFVPTAQFKEFLNTINSHLKTSLKIPADVNIAKRFALEFGANCIVRPKYHGTVHDRETSFSLFEDDALPPFGDDALKYSEATEFDVDHLREKLQNITVHAKKKKKSAAKQAKVRDGRKQMMKSFQHWLGHVVDNPEAKFSVDNPPGSPWANSPVLVAIDVEVLETCHKAISEVGIAILDTDKTKHLAPGELGKNLWPHIVSKHFRVREYETHVNYQFVSGCPDKFDFGTSDFTRLGTLRRDIEAAMDKFTTSTAQDGRVSNRQVIFIGHDMANEDKYLGLIGFSMSNKKVILRVDTKDMHQHLCDGDNGRALRQVLIDLDLDFQNLHNAGNDATYTLRAAIACAVEDMKKQHGLSTHMLHAAPAAESDEDEEEPHQYCI